MFDSETFLKQLVESGVNVTEPRNHAGGNSRIYRFEMRDRKYLLKVYTGSNDRVLRSRSREIESLQFLSACGFLKIPKLFLELSPSDGICLEFLPGRIPKSNEKSNNKILLVFRELRNIYGQSPGFQDAVDACFSTEDVKRQLAERILEKNVDQIDQLERILISSDDIVDFDFPYETLTYSFSDFGAHNIIKRFGQYRFIDLEFFGRDSAIKMFADFLLHPRNRITARTLGRCLGEAKTSFGISERILIRTIPLFAAKWATIVARRMNKSISGKRNEEERVTFQHFVNLAILRDDELILEKLTERR